MSDSESNVPQPQEEPAKHEEPPVSSEQNPPTISPAPDAAATSPATEKPAVEDESTIGTGTSMALGCIAGTVVLIGFGLLFLFLSTLI